MDAVEARQAIERSNPKISVRCLSNAAYLVLRQTIVYCPDFKAVLGVCGLDYAEENCQAGEKTKDGVGLFGLEFTLHAEKRFVPPA